MMYRMVRNKSGELKRRWFLRFDVHTKMRCSCGLQIGKPWYWSWPIDEGRIDLCKSCFGKLKQVE